MWNQISQSCLGAKIPVGKGAKRKKTVWTSSISQFSSRRTKIKKLTEFLYLSQIIGSTRYSYIFLQHLCATHPLVSFDIPPGIYLHQLVTRLNLRKFKEIHWLDGALHIFRFSSLFPQYRKLWPSILKPFVFLQEFLHLSRGFVASEKQRKVSSKHGIYVGGYTRNL